MQKILIIINDAPYGTEKAYNALRMAMTLQKEHADSVEMKMFLLGDAVFCGLPNRTIPNGYDNIERMLKSVIKKVGEVKSCGGCSEARAPLCERKMKDMFAQLEDINKRPDPFEFYTAEDLWTDEHTSEQMLAYHLNTEIDVSSRRKEFIERSADWIATRFHVNQGTRIADFGCGPGLYANRLGKLGAHVTGIDFSKRSIDYARGVATDQGLRVEYVNRNYFDFETDAQFDLIMMIMCDFCALSSSQRTTILPEIPLTACTRWLCASRRLFPEHV